MLQIRLLGQFDVRIDGKRVAISSRAGQSLLAYLVLTAGTAHRREKLAGMFWPDISDENSRRNLRQELWRIRKAITTQQSADGDYLLADEFTLTFNPAAEYWLDVSQLEKPELDLQSLTSNLSLYQGELLPGFYDDWIILDRERIQASFESGMGQLLEQLIVAERWIAIQEWGERWLTFGKAPEPAYRALMLASGVRGDMAKVVSLYQRCTDELQEQLGVQPSAETRALYDGLRKGTKVPLRAATEPSGTVTFLFTDIEESTNLLDKLGDQYAAVLAEHHEILRAAVQKWNGREVDTQGDAFFVTFSRAMDAVQCGAEAQRVLAFHTWPQGEHVRVRMGLHTGEPLISSTGYVGMDVHRASRIGDAGHGGQVLLSQTTRELVLHDLPSGLTIQDLGEHRLKDMKYPASIYQLVIEGLPVSFPALRTKFTGTEAPTAGEAPFKGLQFFDESDSELFFGREVQTTKLVHRLREAQFLSVIIGASGSGKSSLVRAGLIPALKKGDALMDGTKPPDGSAGWQVYVITPTAHPLEALAAQLTRGSESVTATATLMDDLSKDSRCLSLFLNRRKFGQHTLLVVDQFEELFTLCHDDFEREAFIDNLLATITPSSLPVKEERKIKSNITLVLTLRADFYAHLAQYPELRDAVAQQQEYIGPMTSEELRRAIEEPARRGHWDFEPGLVDLILRDVGSEPGALPLLSHALLETWKRRAGHRLTLRGYADSGGVRGAIAYTAETVYQQLSPKQQMIARNIFLRLTELGDGTEDTRRRATITELISKPEETEQVRMVLNTLADARLITTGENIAEVAHEALIREWPRLRDWLTQDREGLILHRHLTDSTHEWELLERDAGALYRGARLAQAREWAVLHKEEVNDLEREFLHASQSHIEQESAERESQRQRELDSARKLVETERARVEEQTQSLKRLRVRNRIVTLVGVVAVVLAVLAGVFGLRSKTNLGIADQQRAVAEANFRQAEAQRLAAEANRLLSSGGNPDQIALLSLQSMNMQYTTQGDAAVAGAAKLDYALRLFTGHTGPLRKIAYSPDGKYLLTGSTDETARLWDAATGREVRQFIGHTNTVWGVAFSPDGKHILTGSFDKTVRLWDAATGKELRQFIGHTDAVSSATFSPDGKYILTGSADKTARLWDAATGQELRQFIGHTDIVWTAAFSPDGKYILTGSADKTARLWDAATGQELSQFTGHLGSVIAAFSPDGKYIATASDDYTARLWDLKTGQELQQFIGHTNPVVNVAFSPDGKYVVTASYDSTARVWDVETGQEARRLTSHTGTVNSAVFSPDGKYVVIAGGDGTARLWDAKPHPELPSFDHTAGVNGVAFSPDGKFALTGGSDSIARLWDATTGQELRQFIGHTALINYGVAISPDGKYILTGSWDKTVRLWDAATGEELRQFTTGDPVNSVTFSPDGKYILAGSNDKMAWLWMTATGQEVRQFPAKDGVQRAVFSPDGKLIATVSFHGGQLWDVATGQESLQFGSGLMNSVMFSPDGKYILSGDEDKTARLWDAATGQELRQFIGHTDIVWTAAFSPDGKYVATASGDGTARLWDTETGQELRRFAGHTAGLENVVFSPDGKYILTGSDDGTARLWDVDFHDTMRYLCSRLLRDFADDERAEYDITDDTPTCPKP